jgi:uncharacterized protein
MTPQERDLVTSLLERLKAQAGQPKDPEADALIRRAVSEQPDAPYLLAQTVLIQDMTLNAAQGRLAELERQLAAAKASPPAAPTSFLPSGVRGSVPSAGGWTISRQQATSPAAAPVWTQSGATDATPGAAAAPTAPPMAAPLAGGAMGSGFLRQAATTAAGIAGGALLFQGIESLFGPHYGSGWLAGVPTQPGITETVTNNYYGEPGAPDSSRADADQNEVSDAADQDLSDTDLADDDSGGDLDDGNYDV